MTRPYRDPGLDTLLGLNGETLFVDDAGLKFVAVRTEPTRERPHGLSQPPTLHTPDGSRLVGFDNAHPVLKRQGPGGRSPDRNHRRRLRTIRPYDYTDAAKLPEDFRKEVDHVLSGKGSIP